MVDALSSTDEQPAGDNAVADATQYGVTTDAPRQRVVQAVCTVWRPMNSHGAVTLMSLSGHRTFHVVEYATPAIRTVLARTHGPTAVRVRLRALSSRGDTWRAVGVTTNP